MVVQDTWVKLFIYKMMVLLQLLHQY
jgi:hypothetical protein